MKIQIEIDGLSEERVVRLERWARWVVHLTQDVYLSAPPEYMHDAVDDVSDLIMQGSEETLSTSMGTCVSLRLGHEGMETWTLALAFSAACVFSRGTLEQRMEWFAQGLGQLHWPSTYYAEEVSTKVHQIMYTDGVFLHNLNENYEEAGDRESDDEEPDLGAFTDYINGMEW
jgi:hypothetical protein